MGQYSGFDRNFSLNGKVAMVTGAASGIGRATAEMLAEKGARLVLIDQSESIVGIAKGIPCDSIGMKMNLTDSAELERAVSKAVSAFGKIDILCNIAGIGQVVPSESVTVKEWDAALDINLKAVFFLSQLVGTRMIAEGKGGRIINMASQAGIVAIEGHVVYSVTKAGVLAITRALALEWGCHGITVNAVSPTVVRTPISEQFWSGKRGEDCLKKIPTGRFGEAEEVAAAVLYLASDSAAMVNGSNLVIDGGYTIS